MKTILKTLILLIAIFSFGNKVSAKAVYIKLGEAIPNVRLHLKTPTVEKNKNMFQLINTETNELLYCIEPGINLNDTMYQEYDYYSGMNNLNSEELDHIARLTYFGYQYKDRTDIKWYVATQYLIWDYLLRDTGEVYFIDSNNEKIDLYKEEQDAILKDIENFLKTPSFIKNDPSGVDYKLKQNEQLILEDTNNTLADYEVNMLYDFPSNKIEVNNNTLKFSSAAIGANAIQFTRKTEEPKEWMKIYTTSNSQIVISRGKISKYMSFVTINIEVPDLIIKKSSTKDIGLSLEGTEYEIYYEDGTPTGKIVIDKNGLGKTNLWPGKYYLKETKAPYGYELNSEKVYFELTEGDLRVELENKPIEKKITIEKYLVDEKNKYTIESDAEFEIYHNNKLIHKLKTNEFGKASINLTFGIYKIVQIKGADGYRISEDIEIIIDEKYNETESIIIKNNIIISNLTIKKVDAITNEPLEGILFGIYDFDKKLIIEEYTNQDGEIKLSNIPLGIYYIKEMLTLNDYELNEDEIEVELKENIESVVTIKNHQKIEVPKTGINNLFLNLILSSSLLIIGKSIYYHEEKR